MGSAWASATIEQFEQVSLENGTELFRVSARGDVDDDPDPRPVLDCGAHDDPHTYEPLSSGGDRRGLLRVAYAVPSSLIDASATFALRLPDGKRIELPRPMAGRSRADERTGRRVDDAPWRPPEFGSPPTAPAGEDAAPSQRPDLDQEREQLQRRVDELTREQAALRSERDEALQAASAAADAAQAAMAERDSVLEATAAARAAHERLARRLRQHDARFELLRADAARTEAAFGPGSTARLRRLEAEHEQIAGHIRALAELMADHGRGSDRNATLNGAAERVVAARDRAVRAAYEQAERDLERMLADTSS